MTQRAIEWFKWLDDIFANPPAPTQERKQQFYEWLQSNKPVKGEQQQ